MAIWQALVDEPRPTIDKHFDGIMAELLREMGGRLWRSRQSCCAGLADLLQGRRWEQVGPHFTQVGFLPVINCHQLPGRSYLALTNAYSSTMFP